VLVRCKEYGLLDLPAVQARLRQPLDQQTTHPESGAMRTLFDCLNLPLTPTGPNMRLIIATHATTSTKKPPIGVLRAGTVYELFLTTLPAPAFTPADILDLYLHRGSFEAVLTDEDREQDPDRWCSRSQWGQECWQILNQWIWNLRLQWGQCLSTGLMRVTELASAHLTPPTPSNPPLERETTIPSSPPVAYGPPQWARRSFTKGFAGSDFALQPDGTLRCPAGHPLTVQERRPERHGSVRLVYGARITHCRPCPLRAQCQESVTTNKPRQVSAVVWPMDPEAARSVKQASTAPLTASPTAPLKDPILWGDWERSSLRRRWLHLLRTQTVQFAFASVQPMAQEERPPDKVHTRAERAHWRLSWKERLARNARPPTAPPLKVTIHGLPVRFAHSFGLAVVMAA
jgi:Transposase DDE domain